MRIYLAGPELFLADADRIAAAKRAVCAAAGHVGVFPTEPPPVPPPTGEPVWFRLYLANEAHIRGCDALIANLTPFRGPSADPGTVYELGLMRGLGRPIAGFMNTDARFGARTLAALGPAARRRGEGQGEGQGEGWEDAEGMAVEEFDLHDNLMIEGGIRAAGGHFATAAVAPAARWTDLAAFARCVACIGQAAGV